MSERDSKRTSLLLRAPDGWLCAGEQFRPGLAVRLEKLKGCNKVSSEKTSGVDAGRPLRLALSTCGDAGTVAETKCQV